MQLPYNGKLVEFGHVFNSSGARNFYTEGYPFHRWIPGLSYARCTFIAKTTTLLPREGNMPLETNGNMPTEFKPDCIRVYPWKGVVLNAVGLSGPGANLLLMIGIWQVIAKPFLLSFMSTADNATARLDELRTFVELLANTQGEFLGPGFGLQINFSCPNVGLKLKELSGEVTAALDIAATLDIPLIPKFNATLPIEQALTIGSHPACHAISISNTIPWGQMPDAINWKALFGTETSPLAKFGGGGLSGKPLLPIVRGWIKNARLAGFTKPIMGGGGILSKGDADAMLGAGASAIELGSVSLLRPWRVQGIINHVNLRFAEQGASYGDRAD